MNQVNTTGNFGGDLLGNFSFDNPNSAPPSHQPLQSVHSGGDLLGGGNPQQTVNPNNNNNSGGGFDLLGNGSTSSPAYSTNSQQNRNIQPPQPEPLYQNQPQFEQKTHKFKAFETEHIELWV